MKDSLGKTNSFYHKYFEEIFDVHLGVGDKYLANKILNNVARFNIQLSNLRYSLNILLLPYFITSSIKSTIQYTGLKEKEKEIAKWYKK